MFTEAVSGKREYEWGHYCSDKYAAARDFDARVAEYQKDYGQPEKNTFLYYSTQRPVDIGTFSKTGGGPSRVVNFDKREPVEQGWFEAWGYLTYTKPLTEKQAGDYELRPASGNADHQHREIVQVVGIWEDERKIPESKRYTWHQPSSHAFALREPVVGPELLERRYQWAIKELTRSDEQRAVPTIAQQLADAAKQAGKDNAERPAQPHKDEKER